MAAVSFPDALDRLPDVPRRPRERLLEALDMYEEGGALQRLNFVGREPGISEEDLARKLQRWLAREDEP